MLKPYAKRVEDGCGLDDLHSEEYQLKCKVYYLLEHWHSEDADYVAIWEDIGAVGYGDSHVEAEAALCKDIETVVEMAVQWEDYRVEPRFVQRARNAIFHTIERKNGGNLKK